MASWAFRMTNLVERNLDRFTRLNRTYYQDLHRIHRLLVPESSRILQIGCGNGDLLASLNPHVGVGLETNPGLAAVARERHQDLQIHQVDVGMISQQALNNPGTFDVIILANILNTLPDVQDLLQRLEVFCHERTRLVISFHNWLAASLKSRRKSWTQATTTTGSWLTQRRWNLLDLSLEVLKSGHRCLLPRHIRF